MSYRRGLITLEPLPTLHKMAGEEDLDAEFALFEQEIAAAETEAVEDDSAAAAAPAAAPAAAAAKVQCVQAK
jgi:hypothetical protein